MALAYVMTQTPGETDKLICDLAARLAHDGVRLAGVVQTNVACSDARRCDMDVQVLPDGPVFRISQTLGPEARGCRLDPAALEEAVAAVSSRLIQRPDVLIVNKFGKHEAEGRGFRDLIAQCIADDIPVLLGVNPKNLKAFLEFSGGLAHMVEPRATALNVWAADHRAQHGETAKPASAHTD